LLSKLFALEKKHSGLSDKERKYACQAEAEPLLEAYWLWLKTLDPVAGSKLEEAVTYAKNQKPYLCAFLEHGNVDISNNLAENAIRPFVLAGRTGCFRIHLRALIQAPSSTHWWKRLIFLYPTLL
jgi:hypothetical protein